MSTITGRWLRHNLFAKPADAALTLVVVPPCAWCLWRFARWALTGADWSVIADSLRVLMVGLYPADQIWRTWVAAFVLITMAAAGIGLVLGPHLSNTRRLITPFCLFGLAAVFVVLSRPGLETWGGLLLSITVTIATSILAIPFGILLAFGRQSRIASLRILCTAYIEAMRSVPLILVVYWIWIVVPLLAPDTPIPGLIRGIAGYALFFAAYVAEYVRSGFQALPRGQVEAARSLGMGTWSTNLDIVLPQALRVVVPALVGQILDIFNGATLVFIIGLTDLLRAGQMILANPQNSARIDEVYVFMFLVYFAIGSMITFASRKLETHLTKGSR